MATPVNPVPEGYHTITPHLVARNAAQAIEFYKRAFGAEELRRMPGPDGKSVLHAEIKVGDSIVMLCDEFPEWKVRSPQSFGGSPVTLHLYVKKVDALFARAVAAGATVRMPVQDTFWGDRYGKLSDPFGHEWSLATRTRTLSLDEIRKGAEAAISQKSAN